MPEAVRHLAFVCPRFASGGTVGGAETLLGELARAAVRDGRRVTFLTTCARNHFTWENELPAGVVRVDGMDVHYFPVDADRDVGQFLRIQERISRGVRVSRDEEERWSAHSVRSSALCEHLRATGGRYDRVLAGPYLFGLVRQAARVHPGRTLLVPCLHDEPFAYLGVVREMFEAVRGSLFNAEPERVLARRLYGEGGSRGAVVGMGIEPFAADPGAFAARTGLAGPYVLYSGRREAAKGTPLLVRYVDAFRGRTGRRVRLVLTGSGPFDEAPFVHDAGFLPEGEKREAMAGAVAFVHPSTLESLGIVLLESFMAGTPALVHAGGAVLRWQCERSGGGLWFRHYPDFEAELLWLLDHEDARRGMGERARRFVRTEYAWDTVARRFFEALETV